MTHPLQVNSAHAIHNMTDISVALKVSHCEITQQVYMIYLY